MSNKLSEAALALLRDYRGDLAATEANRPACRELAAHGLMVAGHSFAGGREAFYRLTEAGVRFREQLSAPSLSGYASPRQ